MQKPLLSRVESAFELPSALARIAQYILENAEEVVHLSQSELGARAKSSQASVYRLSQELGFNGFSEFKLALAGELAVVRASNPPDAGDAPDAYDLVAAGMCESITDTRDLLDPQALAKIASRLLDSESVLIFGAGISAVAAELFFYRLRRAGANAMATRDPRLMLDMTVPRPSMAALAISQSGVSPDSVEFLRICKERRAFTVAVTCHAQSPLGQVADRTIIMARARAPSNTGHAIHIPRAIFVAEAIGLAISRLTAEPNRLGRRDG